MSNHLKKCKTKKCKRLVHVMWHSPYCIECKEHMKWEEEFEDELDYHEKEKVFYLKRAKEYSNFFSQYIGNKGTKVKVQCRKNEIRITKL